MTFLLGGREMRKRILLSVTVVVALVAAAVGGAFAGFVDTEVSENNFIKAGISDLLVNGKNDPIGAKIQFDHAAPCKSVDFWVDLYNWGHCQGGDVYMHFKDVVSEEAGRKPHMGLDYVYDAVTPSTTPGVPDGYRLAVDDEPFGPGVWSSEPEKIAEVGDGYIAQYYISDTDPNLMGEDYASGIAAHTDIMVEVCDNDGDGILDNPDTDGDGVVSPAEKAAATFVIIPSLSGKLADIECNKNHLGFLVTQTKTFIHIDVHIQQIWAEEWYDENGVRWDVAGSTAVGVDYDGDGDIDTDDFQKGCWLTNALQGDEAHWSMLWELITDP
jgi:hypothetical protein